MKGIIWKYHVKADDPDLRDEMGRAGCRVLNPDPDFWENRFPVWAICGPWARARLEVGDVLFFVPTAETSRAARVDGSVCTGYLIVKEILPNDSALLADPRFTPRYKENYSIDLKRQPGLEWEDGEVWSAVLWQIRSAIKDQKIAGQIIFTGHKGLKATTTIGQAGRRLLWAVEQLELDGGYWKSIEAALKDRGIPYGE